MSKRLPGMIHIPLLVFLGISFYQTADGFVDLIGPVAAWGFSAGITLIMYYLSINIGTKRLNGQPIVGLLIFYFACSLFSYSGNFNYVYTQYQTEQLYRDELTQHKEQLNDVLATSTKALNNFSPETNEKVVRVEQLTQQLIRQITDSARPGLGDRARELIREIESVLGEKLTEFAGSPQQIAEKYSNNIRDIAKRKFTAGDLGRVQSLIDKNTEKAKKMLADIGDALSSSEYVKEFGYDINRKTVNTINEIGTDTQEFINDATKFSFTKVQFENQEIGKIAYSYKSGFTQHIFIALLLSLFCFFLDWAVVLYLVVRYRKGEEEPYEKSRVKGVDL